MSWFKSWESFLNGDVSEPPGPIDNSKLIDKSDGKTLGIFFTYLFYIVDIIVMFISFFIQKLTMYLYLNPNGIICGEYTVVVLLLKLVTFKHCKLNIFFVFDN